VGNIISLKNKDNIYTNYKFINNNNLPSVKIDNASNNEFFYQDFEDHPTASNTNAHTGFKCFTNGYTIPFIMLNTRKYVLQYFKFENGVWNLYSEPYTNNKALSGIIDDVRVFPEDALMSSYTYLPLVGMTSEINPAGLTMYYEYDGLGRLITMKDNDKNMIKTFDYNYKKAYKNAEKAITLFRNNNTCGAGGIGNAFTYKVDAGKYQSMVSQAEVDGVAQSDLSTNAQQKANTEGTCTYKNERITRFFSKTCTANFTTVPIEFVVDANQANYSSLISVADANNNALRYINANGQEYANKNGTCNCEGNDRKLINNACNLAIKYYISNNQTNGNNYNKKFIYLFSDNTYNSGNEYSKGTAPLTQIYYNQNTTQSFTKNNCGAGYVGSTETYTAPLFASIQNQAAANMLGTNNINANGQNYANGKGVCKLIYYNGLKSKSFTKTNCNNGGEGSAALYIVNERTFNSIISQNDADLQAQKDIDNNGQNWVNTNPKSTATCTYYNDAKTVVYFKTCPSDAKPVPASITKSVAERVYSSKIDKNNANNIALSALNVQGQTEANNTIVCTYYNDEVRNYFTKTCPLGASPVPNNISTSIKAGMYSSIINKTTANNLAINALNAQGQTEANNTLVCTYFNNIPLSGNFTKQCPADNIKNPLNVSFSVAINQFSSTISLQNANDLATNYFNQQGQTLANSNILCVPCAGLNKKIIDNTCLTGIKLNKGCNPSKFGGYDRRYVYRFNDGTESIEFKENSTEPCSGGGGGRKPIE
ncbi:MAG: DUF5977 domain-containing protein, partial [Sediminibacterium sp.]|nr:DUF5977 domain-containing protein [Sediminibacterium sp.]